MRALRIHQKTGPSGLGVDEVEAPRPGAGEVLVRLEAAGLNHFDLLLASGQVTFPVPLPFIPGIEGAGEVVEVGEAVEADRVGERVTIYPYLGCGRCRFCLVGEEQVCPTGQLHGIGFTRPGTFAERIVVPARNALPLPEGVTAKEAAATTMTGMTAYRLVIGHGRPLPGETVLIRAVGSGVGTVALQLAKAVGARVIGTAGSEAKLRRAGELGMDEGINHAEGSVSAPVKELTSGRGADLVIDYVGSATWDDDLKSLARGGRLVLCGAHTGSKVSLDLWHLFAKEHSLLGSYGGTREDLRRILDLIASRVVSPVIFMECALEDGPKAFEVLERRENFGKIVLQPRTY